MCSPDARTITENLAEAMRFFGRAHQNAEVREMPGVATIYCGLDYAAFNAGVLSQPISGEPGVLEQRIEDPATYFAGRKLRWSYWYCNDFIGKGLMRRARSMLEQHGMIELTDAPGMIAEKLAPVTRSLPAIDVKPVADTNTRAAFRPGPACCFDVPWSICREVYGTDRAWNGTFRGWVGYANGAACGHYGSGGCRRCRPESIQWERSRVIATGAMPKR